MTPTKREVKQALELYGILPGNIKADDCKCIGREPKQTDKKKEKNHMSNIINLNEAKTFPMDAITATDYYLHVDLGDGEERRVLLTGEETVSTTCPKCGKEHTMTFTDFLETMQHGDLYGTTVFCLSCSKKHQEQMSRERALHGKNKQD